MTARTLTALAPLTLALTLGACGGGTTTDSDGTVVVDPAVAPADPAVAVDPVVDPLADSAADVGEAAAEPMDTDNPVLAEAQSDGWVAMQGDWESSAGIVKDRWADLTEEEILATNGDREQLVVLVQDRYGIERDQAENEVRDWLATL